MFEFKLHAVSGILASGLGSALLGIALIAPLSGSATDKGQPAPAFELPNLKQETIKLSAYKGKVVYLDFWASWCGPCRKTFPWMNEMQKKYSKSGFEVVAINVDQKKELADGFLAKSPAEFTVLLDSQGAVPKKFEIQGMPSSFIIDRNGIVQLAHKGFKEGQAEELESEIRKLIEASK